MITSVENILSDILQFLRKAYKTFFAVFARSYSELIKSFEDGQPGILSPTIYLVLSATVFYNFTIGMNNVGIARSAGLFGHYFSSLKNYSLPEKIMYSISIWIAYFFLVKMYSKVLAPENRSNFRIFTAYLTGTFLIIYIISHAFLSFVHSLSSEALYTSPYFYSWDEIDRRLYPLTTFMNNLRLFIPFVAFLTCLYKLLRSADGFINVNLKQALFLSLLSSLVLQGTLVLTKKQINIQEKYFPQDEIEMTNFSIGNNEIVWLNLDSAKKIETTLFITNKSDENIFLDPKDSAIFQFGFRNRDRSALGDTLSKLKYSFRTIESIDTSLLIVEPKTTKMIKVVSVLKNSTMSWLMHQCKHGGASKDVYFIVKFKSTNRYFSPPYYRRKVNIYSENLNLFE